MAKSKKHAAGPERVIPVSRPAPVVLSAPRLSRPDPPAPPPTVPPPIPAAPNAAPPAAVQPVVLLEASVSAHGVLCPAGTVIAPNIDGWPAHRVAAHVRNGRAK